MSRTMLPIDCHVLTSASDNPEWSEALRADLEREGVTQHWLPGIPGQHAKARAVGFRCGEHEYVSKIDPDDRLMNIGTFQRLYEALEAHPFAPFAWAGEVPTDEYLMPLDAPNIHPGGYNPKCLANSPMHVHGVVLWRRALVQRVLPQLETLQGDEALASDWLMNLLLAAPQGQRPEDWQPIHIPIISLLWRQHSGQAHERITPNVIAATQKRAGITPKFLTITRRAQHPKRTTPTPIPGCPNCGRP